MAQPTTAPATRTLKYEPAGGDYAYSPICGTLDLTVNGKSTTYIVEELPTGWNGRGFELTKLGTLQRESYSVFMSRDGAEADSCDCGSFTFRGECKHQAALRVLLSRGKL